MREIQSVLAFLLVVSCVVAQISNPGGQISNLGSQNKTCGDYIQFFCSRQSDCPQPQPGSSPIILVNGEPIDLRDFNAVSFDNFVARTGVVQGRVACSGNFAAGNGFSIGEQLETQKENITSAMYPFGLVVGGNAFWGSGRMSSEGIFVAGRSEGDVFEQTYGGVETCFDRQDCLDPEFNSARQYFIQVSRYFASQQPNTQFSIQFSTLSIQCSSSAPLYVVNITAEELRDITSSQVSPTCNASALWLFNVGGEDSVIFRGDFFRQPALSILWNVVGSKRSVNVFTQVRGNILAPECTFTQPSGVVDGNVIAGDMLLVLQINTPKCLPLATSVVPIPEIPPSFNQTIEAGEYCPFWEEDCKGYEFTLGSKTISFKNYHVISFGNFVANTGDIAGRLAVRNDLYLGCGFSIGFELNTGGENATEVPEEYSLIVGNNARWWSGALFPDGSGAPFEGQRENMFIGRQLTAPAYLQLRKTASSCENCLASAFSSARACYTNTSNNYANLRSNVDITFEFSTLNLICNNANETQYVMFISGEQISQATSWIVSNCNNSAFFIINVVGNDTVTFNRGSIPLAPSNVLYNILGCGRIINVQNGLNGAILAPYNILNQTGGAIVGKVVVGDVLFALNINIVRCPLRFQDNTTLISNQTQTSNTTGASALVTTGVVPTAGGMDIGSTSGSLNQTLGQYSNSPQYQCPVIVIGSASNNTITPSSNTTYSSINQIPSRAFDTQDQQFHNNGEKLEVFFGLLYLVSLLF